MLFLPRLIFVCLTNILLLTSLVSLVSNSLTEVSLEIGTQSVLVVVGMLVSLALSTQPFESLLGGFTPFKTNF